MDETKEHYSMNSLLNDNETIELDMNHTFDNYEDELKERLEYLQYVC